MRARPKLTVGVDVDDGVELSVDHSLYTCTVHMYICMCVCDF